MKIMFWVQTGVHLTRTRIWAGILHLLTVMGLQSGLSKTSENQFTLKAMSMSLNVYFALLDSNQFKYQFFLSGLDYILKL